jgi:hypothetical protein
VYGAQICETTFNSFWSNTTREVQVGKPDVFTKLFPGYKFTSIKSSNPHEPLATLRKLFEGTGLLDVLCYNPINRLMQKQVLSIGAGSRELYHGLRGIYLCPVMGIADVFRDNGRSAAIEGITRSRPDMRISRETLRGFLDQEMERGPNALTHALSFTDSLYDIERNRLIELCHAFCTNENDTNIFGVIGTGTMHVFKQSGEVIFGGETLGTVAVESSKFRPGKHTLQNGEAVCMTVDGNPIPYTHKVRYAELSYSDRVIIQKRRGREISIVVVKRIDLGATDYVSFRIVSSPVYTGPYLTPLEAPLVAPKTIEEKREILLVTDVMPHNHICESCGRAYKHQHKMNKLPEGENASTHKQHAFQCAYEDCRMHFSKSHRQTDRTNPTNSAIINLPKRDDSELVIGSMGCALQGELQEVDGLTSLVNPKDEPHSYMVTRVAGGYTNIRKLIRKEISFNPFNSIRNLLTVEPLYWDFRIATKVLAQLERSILTVKDLNKAAITDLLKLGSVQSGGTDLYDYALPLVVHTLNRAYRVEKTIVSLAESDLVTNFNGLKREEYMVSKNWFERVRQAVVSVFSRSDEPVLA